MIYWIFNISRSAPAHRSSYSTPPPIGKFYTTTQVCPPRPLRPPRPDEGPEGEVQQDQHGDAPGHHPLPHYRASPLSLSTVADFILSSYQKCLRESRAIIFVVVSAIVLKNIFERKRKTSEENSL